MQASAPEFADFLRTFQADFYLIAAYAEIVKENILTSPTFCCLNVHGSILPKYRGAAPVQRAIMAGEVETGVTIMKLTPQMDAGDIFAIRTTPIPLEMNAGELLEKLAYLGREALWEVMQEIYQGRAKPIEQEARLATYAKKISAADTQVTWDRPCLDIHNQIRGVTPHPGAWCWVQVGGMQKRLQIHRTRPLPAQQGRPGEILSEKELIIGCKQGALRLEVVQLEGKKPLEAPTFLRGTPAATLSFLSDLSESS
jgi:methionyl-tRNA formyltransferase